MWFPTSEREEVKAPSTTHEPQLFMIGSKPAYSSDWNARSISSQGSRSYADAVKENVCSRCLMGIPRVLDASWTNVIFGFFLQRMIRIPAEATCMANF